MFPSNTALLEKSPLFLNCECDNNTVPGAVVFTWKFIPRGHTEGEIVFNGRDISQDFDRFNILNGNKRCHLALNKTRLTDAGVYECEIYSKETNARYIGSARLVVLGEFGVCVSYSVHLRIPSVGPCVTCCPCVIIMNSRNINITFVIICSNISV